MDIEEYPNSKQEDCCMTQQEVAEALGLSRSRVSEIETIAIDKFKTRLFRNYTKEDLL